VSRAIALLILLAQCGLCGAQELGRLFFSPAEREALDARRREKSGGVPTAAAQAPVRIDGYVLRSGGRPTVWVNGGVDRLNENVKAGSTLDRAGVRDVIGDGEVRVQR